VRKRLENLRSETARLGGEVKLQTERLKIADAALLRARQMRALDLVPVARLDQARQDRIDQALKLSEVERSLSALTRELHMAERDDRELPLKLKTQVGELGRNAAAIDQELADAEVRRSYVVVAPQDGVVTGIQAETGGAVGATSPVLSILPDASVLEAQMFAPSRAVGFVKPGQKVLLRYQAYPYEKFGTQGGIVASVSQAAVSPSELPPQLAGLTALYSPNDPLYRISVRLDGQSVDAYGEKKPLQAGMQVDADVMTDRRSIVEWMFEPLYSITGKWGR
jgi:membrane fusion protein